MDKKLVIVESPAKAKTIGKILGKSFVVKSSMGHVRDLPERRLGVEVEKSFKPKYVVVPRRKQTVNELKKTAKECGEIYLAPDPDREGEAIAWHLKCVLEDKNDQKAFLRVQYNEITPGAVRNAFQNPSELDMNRVNAQQARRILDRIVGYKVSPLLWSRIKRGLSAGRVQSVALRLICEREREISSFVPEVYWIVGAVVRKLVEPLDPFRIRLARIDDKKAEIKSAEQAEAIKKDLESRQLQVTRIATKEVSRKAPPPFITSTLQQAASNYLGYSPKRTMGIAQQLYEGVDLGGGPVGLITYMRTDSFSISKDAIGQCRDLIERSYGKEYVPEKPNYFKSRSGAQEAHEAIRPTDVDRDPKSLSGKLDSAEFKLYSLIWNRFVASQMPPARIAQKTISIEPETVAGKDRKYIFLASSSEVKFPGYMKVADDRSSSRKKEKPEDSIPPLAEGEKLERLKWESERKETQPPPRYSEATLIKALENNGVGRPSTYAQTVSTLHDRKYVEAVKKQLAPTELGLKVNDMLTEHLDSLFNVKFTASMEEQLDRIEGGQLEWTDMLKEFYDCFNVWLSEAKGPPADAETVGRLLAGMDHVVEWRPETKRGKRVYGDERFVNSIRKQIDGDKEVSQRQLEALLRIALIYKDKVPEVASALEGIDGKLLEQVEADPPREATVRKLALLKQISLDEATRDFVASLGGRVEQGRKLTDAQLRALDSIVQAHKEEIPGFEKVKEQLDIDQNQAETVEESRTLIQAMSSVSEWKEPVKRGKRVYDDGAFYNSLKDYFDQKGSLSPRQLAALKKMATRYSDQIDNYESLAEQMSLGRKKSSKHAADKEESADKGD